MSSYCWTIFLTFESQDINSVSRSREASYSKDTYSLLLNIHYHRNNASSHCVSDDSPTAQEAAHAVLVLEPQSCSSVHKYSFADWHIF